MRVGGRKQEDGSNFYYYHYDGSGNVTSVTDGSADEVAIYEYDSFGNVLTEAINHTCNNWSRKPPSKSG